jgi:hypothetical protein
MPAPCQNRRHRHKAADDEVDDGMRRKVDELVGDGTRLFAGERAELVPAESVAGTVTHLRLRVA